MGRDLWQQGLSCIRREGAYSRDVVGVKSTVIGYRLAAEVWEDSSVLDSKKAVQKRAFGEKKMSSVWDVLMSESPDWRSAEARAREWQQSVQPHGGHGRPPALTLSVSFGKKNLGRLGRARKLSLSRAPPHLGSISQMLSLGLHEETTPVR